jgi:hypothetical protein
MSTNLWIFIENFVKTIPDGKELTEEQAGTGWNRLYSYRGESAFVSVSYSFSFYSF